MLGASQIDPGHLASDQRPSFHLDFVIVLPGLSPPIGICLTVALLISGFGEDATASPLTRVLFSKIASVDATYREEWLQHLTLNSPRLLDLWTISL
jgi:hypothetical protein